MSRSLRIPLVVGVFVLVLVASGAATPRSTGSASLQRSCPATAPSMINQDISATPRIIAAVRKGVPRVFRKYTTQGGGPGWHHYQVVGLFSLSPGYLPEPGVISRYRRQVMSRCGRAVADNTWIVFLYFPEGPMASTSPAHMFVVRTPRGWRAWYGSWNSLG